MGREVPHEDIAEHDRRRLLVALTTTCGMEWCVGQLLTGWSTDDEEESSAVGSVPTATIYDHERANERNANQEPNW